MQAAVLANSAQKEELTATGGSGLHEIVWVNSLEELLAQQQCSILADFLFEHTEERTAALLTRSDAVVIIHSVADTIQEIHPFFIRINAWPGFLQRTITEAAAGTAANKEIAEQLFLAWGRPVQWVDDKPGFIAARVIAMIINEAYLALGEKVSTKEAIDTAMKLGTNYPWGPFEWAEKIGVDTVYALLKKLSGTDNRYNPAAALLQEITE
jgi:3-hydroxybutyryl-CoA dehydrogenase